RRTDNRVKLPNPRIIEGIEQRACLMMRRQRIVSISTEVIHAHDFELPRIDRFPCSNKTIPPAWMWIRCGRSNVARGSNSAEYDRNRCVYRTCDLDCSHETSPLITGSSSLATATSVSPAIFS